MNTTYHVSLLNLDANMRPAAGSLATIERPEISESDLRTLLLTFCEIDAVENAVAEPEIRVRVRNESYRILTGQKKLMFYDAIRRELPALVLTVEEAMAELNGSAPAARNAAVLQYSEVAPGETVTQPAPVYPVEKASKPRLVVLGAMAVALLCAMVYVQPGKDRTNAPASFHPITPAEAAELQTSLTGVYMTGNQPGQHGIVFNTAADLKLFELGALAAPRVVYASGMLGRTGSHLALATDQPGGLIKVTDHDTLTYCGEIYRRIP